MHAESVTLWLQVMQHGRPMLNEGMTRLTLALCLLGFSNSIGGTGVNVSDSNGTFPSMCICNLCVYKMC